MFLWKFRLTIEVFIIVYLREGSLIVVGFIKKWTSRSNSCMI